MAISSLDGVIAGMRPPEPIIKVGATMAAIGRFHSHFYSPGAPGAGTAPSNSLNGAAITTASGQIPFTNPGSGNSYLARFSATASNPCTLLLCDRLWANSAINLTSTSAQAITPAALPARDSNGSTNGAGIMAGLEFSVAGGAATPTVTLVYTNSAAATGKTVTFAGSSAPPIGTFFTWPLAAGDVGVRGPTSITFSTSYLSGTAHIVLYRILATLECPVANVGDAVDALTSGFPRLYDNTCPFILQIPSATTATNISGTVIYTQG